MACCIANGEELDDHDLKQELVEAKDRLEQMICKPITEAACPWGGYDRRVLAVLRRSNYQRVFTSDEWTGIARCLASAANPASCEGIIWEASRK